MSRIFISYRRDDASGYAGRLEEALEKRLGRGCVFRDVLDIPPGEDFVAAIRARLSEADTVLVLIGPRWAGDQAGARRIDDPQDFVHLEVLTALESGVRVVPVLLQGASMPAEATLPDALKPLVRRNAISLSDANWSTDIERLTRTLGDHRKRACWKWALAGAVVAAALVTGFFVWRALPPPDASERFIGQWQGTVRYSWGDRYEEVFDFKRHAGTLAGTASFLKYPRAIESLRVEGRNLHFEIRSQESMSGSTKEVTRSYAAELRGEPPTETLAVRLLTSNSHTSHPPIEFEARRISASAPAAGQ